MILKLSKKLCKVLKELRKIVLCLLNFLINFIGSKVEFKRKRTTSFHNDLINFKIK